MPYGLLVYLKPPLSIIANRAKLLIDLQGRALGAIGILRPLREYAKILNNPAILS